MTPAGGRAMTMAIAAAAFVAGMRFKSMPQDERLISRMNSGAVRRWQIHPNASSVTHG
jgi:hypothetical protein